MGIKIDKTDIADSVVLRQKLRVFPGFNDNEERYIHASPRDGSCVNSYSVHYDTDYAVVATDESALQGLLQLAAGVLAGVASGGPTPGTIINGIAQANDVLQTEIKTKSSTEPLEIRLPVKRCAAGKMMPDGDGKKGPREREPGAKVPAETLQPAGEARCYDITLEVTGQWILTDADKDDQHESAVINLFLWSGTSTSAEFRHARGVSTPVNIPVRPDEPFRVELKGVRHEADFDVYAKVSATTTTDGRYVLIDSASIIRIDSVFVTISEVACTG